MSTLKNHSSAVSVGLIPATAPTTRSLVAYQAGAVLAQSDALADACTRAAWVHVDHAGWAIVPWLRGRGVTTPVSVDGGNPISGLDVATVALYAPSAAELMRSTGTNNVDDGLDAALDRGARVCIATLGSTGAVARSTVDPGERDFTGLVSEASVPSSGPRTSRWTVRAGAASAAIRSTLGAGDVYHGALLAALLRGDALAPAMQFAAVASAWSCRAVDGRSAIPAAADVDATVASVPVEVEVWHPQGRHVPGGPMAAASR